MYIILGGTGHVGSSVTMALLDRGEGVTIVARDDSKTGSLRDRGAKVALADVHDSATLRSVLALGRRAFLLNPPADPSTDTDAEERQTIAAIIDALHGSGLEGIVAGSTYGAQPGDRIGDLGTLYTFEEKLRAQPIPAGIIRAAYYMSNLDALLPSAREHGVIPTMFPADLKIPMVAHDDLGRAAARLLTGPAAPSGLHFVEGPDRYSYADVAAAFAAALGRTVDVEVTPREGWIPAYRKLGFSEPAARSYAGMTGISVDGGFDMPTHPERGKVSLTVYVSRLVKAGGDRKAR